MPQFLKYILIIIFASLLFFPFLGHVHLFDWDEINFAECAREMLATKEYMRVQIDFQPFWEKPPLFIWMQALSMKLWGVNEFAARFPNALIGVITLVTLYYVGKKTINEKVASWWVILYVATWLPHFYFKSGIIDPTFNLLIFAAFFQVHLLRHSKNKVTHALLCGLFLGLAVMTKGPVAILIAGLGLAVYFVLNRGAIGIKWTQLALVFLAAFVTTGIWFGLDIIHNGWWFTGAFIRYQIRLFTTGDAGHGQPFFYHFLVLLIGCFPASAFLFQYTRKRQTNQETAKDFTRWMWILFWVVLLLFSIVKTKIVHYSSLCYFPLTYLAALQLYKLSEGTVRIKPVVRVLLLTLGSLLALAITLLPLAGIYKQKLVPLIDDPFAVGNLQANVPWSFAECLYGLAYLAVIIVTFILIRRNFRKWMLMLCVAQVLIIQITVIHFTPKIEAYSQRAAISFYESMQGKDVYVQVLGFKSYAHLFYTMKEKPSNPRYYNEQWLLHGMVDKPVFFVCKVQDADDYRKISGLEEIGSKNGFVFFRRK